MFKQYNIDFPKATVQGKRITFPVTAVYQTRSHRIENECVERWPDITGPEHAFSFAEMQQVREMESFITKNLVGEELDALAAAAFDMGWMAPVTFDAKTVVAHGVDRVRCARWENNTPYLTVSFLISVDITKLLSLYAVNGWFKLKFTTTISTRECEVMFEHEIPLILRYSQSPRIGQTIVDAFSYMVLNRNNTIGHLFAKYWSMKDLKKYDVRFEPSPNGGYRVFVAGVSRLMIDTIKANPIKTAAALAVAGAVMKRIPLARKKTTVG